MDNYAFAEHLRKNYVTIDSSESGEFQIGGLDFKDYAGLVHAFREACSYLLKRSIVKTHGPYIHAGYDTYRPDIENIRLIFWIGLLHNRILNELAEELKSYSKDNFWGRYRSKMWEHQKLFGSYDYCKDTIVMRLQEQVNTFQKITEKSGTILTILGNEEVDTL